MNRSSTATRAFAPLLALALAGLVGLALLQYHWVDQISAGERERRQANLALGAARMGEDFNRELARAYLALQMDAATLRDEAWERYAHRLERWQQTAPYPGLVKDVYLVRVNQIGRIGLNRYTPATQSFESLAWPYELMPIRRRVERTYQAIWAQGGEVRVTVPPVDRAGPSLVIPIARPWLLSTQQEPVINADLLFSDLVIPSTITRCTRCPPELYNTPLLAQTIVVLDQEYIAATFLPALAERYFPSLSSLDYQIGVVDQANPNRLIFSSDSRLSASSFSAGDATVDIFEITYDELTALILTSDPRLDSGQTDSRDRVVVSVLGRPEADADQSAAQGQWRLVFKHRQGSLEAAVAGLRTRNILISFGALLLLGGSMAMLLISTRRAQRLAQQQIAFASAVSHELRTPLAVICSAGENLADGVVPDAQKARQYGAVIANEGRRLAEMVDQVLAFAGAQSGREPYHMQRTEVAPVIEGAIYALRPALRDGGFALELRLAPDLPPLNADAAALGRALQNLISNAMKYGAEDGWIGVTAEVIAGEAGRELQISVRDNGGKIHQEDLPHLFEPFYRGRSARATSSHGSGLGLSMVRHAVAAHGGRVSVESRPGVGTRFTLHLPLGGTMAVAQQAGATV